MRQFASTIATLFVYCCTLAGCESPGLQIPTAADRPLKSDIETTHATVIDDRYLLLPVGLERAKQDGKFYSGALLLSGSAWSGLGVGKSGYSGGQWLNLKVVDLAGEHHTVFDRQVAFGGWGHSLRPTGDRQLRYPDLLLLTARTSDTNADKQIDSRDAIEVFTYNLARKELRRVSPDGFDVENVDFAGEKMVLTLRALTNDRRVAIYVVAPPTGAGSLAAEGLTP